MTQVRSQQALPGFQQTQKQFAAHIRDPEKNAAPLDVEPRRMQVYLDLFYNNVESFLSNGFPVLRSLMTDVQWHAMARDFFARHNSKSPYFVEIAQEFIHYLQQDRVQSDDDLPFLLELAHYEWLELAADVDAEQIPGSGFNPEGNLLHGRPVLSPLVYVASYEYPVHLIGPDFIPDAPSQSPTYLIIYRNDADQVRFMEINAVTAQLLLLLQENPDFTGADAIEAIQAALQHPQPDVVREGGKNALQHLRECGIVLGTELKSL